MAKTGPKTEEGIKAVTKNLTETAWELSEKGREAMAIAGHMAKLKHGLYATIPIRCKAGDCPYADVCRIQIMGKAPQGDHCPVETSTIEELVKRYMAEFEVEEKDMVDISMIRNLVDIDISILRCNKKLATDAEVVQNIVIAVTEEGQPIRQPQINKAYELQDRLLNRRQKILSLLNGTRKDKKDDEAVIQDPSSIIANMKNQLNKFAEEKNNTIDVTEINTEEDED